MEDHILIVYFCYVTFLGCEEKYDREYSSNHYRTEELGMSFRCFKTAHVKISQLVNKICSQQVVTMLLFYEVVTRLSLTTC